MERPSPTADQLGVMTEAAIDTELSRLWEQEEQADTTRLRLSYALHKQLGDPGRRVRGALHPIFSLSWEQVLEQAIIKARAPYTEHESYVAREIDRMLTNWAMASRKVEDLAAEIKVYTDEYRRRGGWNRVYLAQSHDGHAHSGTECGTCHHGEQRTRFAWLVQYSGKTEAEIIADAGDRACATCYPSIRDTDLKRPTKMFTPDEIEAQKAREERAQTRERRTVERATKGITAPDGSELKDGNGYQIKTERTAVIEATSGLSSSYANLRIEQIIKADPGLAPFFLDRERRERSEAKDRAAAVPLIEAVAYKRGADRADVVAELEAKAYAKAKRDMGKDWAVTFKRMTSFRDNERAAYLAQCKKEGREPWTALSLRWFKV